MAEEKDKIEESEIEQAKNRVRETLTNLSNIGVVVVEKPSYLSINRIEKCYNCGNKTVIQKPQDMIEGWGYCQSCKRKFRVEIK